MQGEQANGIRPPPYKQVQYHRELQKNMDIVKSNLETLKCRKEDIEERLKAESGPLRKLATAEVRNWLQNAEVIIDEAPKMERKAREVKYCSRASLGKLVEEKIQKVKDHYEKGTFGSLVIDELPASGFDVSNNRISRRNDGEEN